MTVNLKNSNSFMRNNRDYILKINKKNKIHIVSTSANKIIV